MTIEQAIEVATKSFSQSEKSAVLFSPFLTLEELWLARNFTKKVLGLEFSSESVAMQVETRELSKVEKVLISPDYAPNARAGLALGLVADTGANWREALEDKYNKLLKRLSDYKQVFIIGDFAILDNKLSAELSSKISSLPFSLAITSLDLIHADSQSAPTAAQFCKVVLPGANVYQKSGLMLNKDNRVQRLNKFFEPVGKYDAVLLEQFAAKLGKPIISQSLNGRTDFSERELFFEMVKDLPGFSNLTLQKVGVSGCSVGA